MYLLINSDNTINYGNDHPIDQNLDFEGLKLIEFPDKTLEEVVGDIAPLEALWDEDNQRIIRNPIMVEDDEFQESAWRNKELNSVLNLLDQYERDQKIPYEFRTTKISEYEYTELLRYRKKLCDYPETSDYKIKLRPTVNTIIRGLSK